MKSNASSDKVLVCGGTGFIGQTLVERLVKEGRKVRLLVYDFIPPRLQSLEDNIECFPGNILDSASLKPVLSEVSTVINLVGDFFGDKYKLNIRTSYNLLGECKGTDIRKIIFTSSEAVYGESFDTPVTEADQPKPVTEYALSKYVAEYLYRLHAEAFDISATVLRMANVYGPGQIQGVVYNFISAILQGHTVTINNDGTQKRDFLYIDDAIEGIVRALDYDCNENFDIFNISGGEIVSLMDLVALIGKVSGRTANIEYINYEKPDIQCLWSSYQKAKDVLGYEPRMQLEEGIKKTFEHLANSLKEGDK